MNTLGGPWTYASEICLVIVFILKIKKLRLRDTKKHNEDYSAIEKWDLEMATTPWCLYPPSHHRSAAGFFHLE